ncbi:MAG: tetratricopeptide repeat protein [bacterium]|nr:tetratricopeptide repeat protein [bacterium]
MTYLKTKKGPLWFSIGAVVIFSFFLSRDSLARFAWQKYHSANLAFFLDHGDADLALKIGNYYFNVYKDGVYDLNKAKKYFNKALEIDPKTPDAWHQLARIDFLKGDFTLALEKINKQIEIHGDSFMASFYIRGLIEGYAGDFDQAEKDFKKFIEWDRQNWAALNDLAWIYFKKGDYKNAENMAEIGLKIAPQNPWLLTVFGVSMLNQNQKEEAKKAFIQAKINANLLTEADWHKAYPGNDPKSAGKGLESMKKIIESDLSLIQ